MNTSRVLRFLWPKPLIPLVILAISVGSTALAQSVESAKGTSVYEATWESIAQNYQCPDWFRNAKFGIFIHWGVYSVPAFNNEWYPREMYIKDSSVWEHHRQEWGDQAEFGYKDFIPMFTAEKFDPKEWAELFKLSGARYVVPVAEHHDGFAMYNSKINPWNAVTMGPKRDIIGELKEAVEEAGMVFGVSSHRMENAWFYNGGMAFPSDVQDSTITLYGKRYQNEHYTSEWCQHWLEHTREIIDLYQPQLLWFDWTVNADILKPYFNQMMAYYYNSAIDWDKGVVVNTKQGYPTNVQVWDMERGKTDKMMLYPWQTDTSIGKKSWCYIDGEENKSAEQIVHDLVDIVSKNGNLLLNIGPRSDGTITEQQRDILLDIGRWLDVNGEAIYGTRCWKRFGEGETLGTKGTFTDGEATSYTASDIRFTTKDNVFYAIALNWDDEILIKSLNLDTVGDAQIQSISLLGSEDKLEYELLEEGLRIRMPNSKPCEYAYSIRIAFDKPVGENLPPEATNQTLKHGV